MIATALRLADTWQIVRLSLHVLAASLWVGGQFTMAGLVPVARGVSADAPQKLAKAFGRLSWPAFWVLVITGFWNFVAVNPANALGSWNVTFDVKVVAVVLAGWGAWRHTKATSAAARGAYAGLSALFSVVALVLGVSLAG